MRPNKKKKNEKKNTAGGKLNKKKKINRNATAHSGEFFLAKKNPETVISREAHRILSHTINKFSNM
jgi:hypothetical protein